MHSFDVHSNESACRKSGRLGLEQVMCIMSDLWRGNGNKQGEGGGVSGINMDITQHWNKEVNKYRHTLTENNFHCGQDH